MPQKINGFSERLHSLRNIAQSILEQNTREGRYTVPSANLYPYQWNWDSGFAALGFAHFDLSRALLEINTLFSGQWDNGMLPHILFHSKKREGYFPGPAYWRSDMVPAAPKTLPTSGISQPPVHGFILEKIFELYPESSELKDFVKHIFPKLLKLHEYYYTERDPFQEGLVYIFHPWASGRDNSPLWDELVKHIEVDKNALPAYERFDNKKADPSERPSDRDYDVYVYLMELGKKWQYDGVAIAEESPFMIQDTLFNSALIRSNEALIRLGKLIRKDIGQVQEWQEVSQRAYQQKLWSDELGVFAPYDIRAEKHIPLKEIGAYTALFAGIPSEKQARIMKKTIQDIAASDRGFRLMPSFDPANEVFDPKRYWKGPIWPQMNWLVHKGLKRYGFDAESRQVKWDFLELVDKLGFYEYFDPRQEVADQLANGYGGDQFTWTAAVFLELTAKE